MLKNCLETGTMFGFRDGWAIGISGNYVVGVWVGNADGEGRPGLTGISAAAPILFEIFGSLPKSQWFKMPVSDLKQVDVCAQSGFWFLSIVAMLRRNGFQNKVMFH